MKLFNMRMKYGTHYIAGDGAGNGAGGGGGGDGDNGGGKPGGEASSWRDSLPEEIKEDKALADFTDPGGLAKAYLDTKADVGRSLRLPGPDASLEDMQAFNISLMQKVPTLTAIPGEGSSDEAINEFYRQLGRPDEISGYKIPETDDPMAKAGLLELATDAHKEGLSQDQFIHLADNMLNNHKKAGEEMSTKQRDDYDMLKVDWGAGLEGKTKAVLELAKATDAPQAMIDAITNRTIGSATMKWLDSVVTSLSGDGSQINFQGAGHEDTRMSPAEANAQVEEVMNKKEYWDPSSPLHEGLKKKVVDLQRIASS